MAHVQPTTLRGRFSSRALAFLLFFQAPLVLGLGRAHNGMDRSMRGFSAANRALPCLESSRKEVHDRRSGVWALDAAFRQADMEPLSNGTFPAPSLFKENIPIVMEQPRVTVCMVEKCGSSRFKLLLLRGMGYTAQELLGNSNAIKPHAAELRTSPRTLQAYLRGLESPEYPRVIIVRSPYTRLLSAFLNKIMCVTCSEGSQSERNAQRTVDRMHKKLGVPLDIRSFTTQDGFRSFVTALHATYTKRKQREREKPRSKSSSSRPAQPLDGIDPHFAPISTLCLLNAGFAYDYVLKLEEMDHWYADFLELTGLQDEAAEGWNINSFLNVVSDPGEPCFYRPKGASCADIYALQASPSRSQCSPARPESTEQDGLRGRPLQRSATQSDSLIRSFYDAELAAKVTEMYSQDLELLGYLAWGGETDYESSIN